MKKLLSLYLIFNFTLNANEITFLKKGNPAPSDGYHFDLEAEQKNRFELIDKDNMAKQLQLYQDNEKIYDSQVKTWKAVATDNTERLLKVQNSSFWQNALFFGLGVIATSALAIGLSKGLK